MQARISLRSQLVLGTAVVFGLRLVLSAIRTGPVLVADETGYLSNARLLAGGIPGQLHLAPFYRGGYSLLLTPLVQLGSDPTVAYHAVLVLNAALAASTFPLLYLLLTRHLSTPPALAVWAALAGAAYPAVTVLSQVAMSENALFPLVCLWLIAMGGLLEAAGRRQGMIWCAALGAATGALWAVHNRMIAAVLVGLAAMLWVAARRRVPAVAVAVGVAVLAVGLAGTHLLDQYLIDHLYGGSASGELSTRLGDLFGGHGLRTAAANLVGQTWYLLAATFGLAAVVVADYSRRRRELVGALLAFTAILLLVSAAAFPERTRPDMLIYGRYTEVVAPALVAVGIAAFGAVTARWRLARPLAGFAILTGVVALIRATASDPDAPNRWNISALPFVTARLGVGILIGAAIVATGGALLLTRVARRSPGLLGASAIVLFLAVSAYGVWNPVRSSQRAVYPEGWTSPEAVADRHGIDRVSYDLDHYDAIGLYATQWFLPHTSESLFHGDREKAPGRFVIAGTGPPQPGARRLWTFVGRDQALWELPKAPPGADGAER